MSTDKIDDEMRDLDQWDPMGDDYKCIYYNSYCSGPGAQLPLEMLPSYRQSQGECPKNEHKMKLHVSRIPFDLTENGLKNYLTRIGCKPKHVKIIHDSQSKSGAYGFVDFATQKEAFSALQIINNRPPYNFRVNFAITEDNAKRKQKAIDDQRNERKKKLEMKKQPENNVFE